LGTRVDLQLLERLVVFLLEFFKLSLYDLNAFGISAHHVALESLGVIAVLLLTVRTAHLGNLAVAGHKEVLDEHQVLFRGAFDSNDIFSTHAFLFVDIGLAFFSFVSQKKGLFDVLLDLRDQLSFTRSARGPSGAVRWVSSGAGDRAMVGSRLRTRSKPVDQRVASLSRNTSRPVLTPSASWRRNCLGADGRSDGAVSGVVRNCIFGHVPMIFHNLNIVNCGSFGRRIVDHFRGHVVRVLRSVVHCSDHLGVQKRNFSVTLWSSIVHHAAVSFRAENFSAVFSNVIWTCHLIADEVG